MLLFLVIFTSKWCLLCINVQCISYTKFIVCMLLGQRARSWKTCRKCWEVETSVSRKNSEQLSLSFFFLQGSHQNMEVLIAENWKYTRFLISYLYIVNQIFIQNPVTILTNHHELIKAQSKMLYYLDLLLYTTSNWICTSRQP